MTTSYADSLWAEFAIETEEHIALVEPLLVNLENTAVAAADIAQLFRSFHSIKGVARAMDMRAMEAVSHEAENLLGVVREGRSPLDAPVVNILLDALDALKAMRLAAVDDQRDVPLPEELIARLNHLFEQRRHGDEPAAPAAPAFEPPPPGTAGTAEAVAATAFSPPPATIYSSSPSPAPACITTAATAATFVPEHEDPELVAYYRTLVDEHFPILIRALLPQSAEPEGRGEVCAAADALAHASEMMGFSALAEDFAKLASLAAQEHAWSPGDISIVNQLMAEVRERLTPVRELDGPAGVTPVSLDESLHAVLASNVNRLLDAFGTFLQHLQLPAGQARPGQSAWPGQQVWDESDQDVSSELSRIARELYAFLTFADLGHTGRLILLIEDIFCRIAGGEMFLTSELLQLTGEAVAAFRRTRGRTDLPAQEADALIGRFRTALLDGVSRKAGVDPISSVRQVLAGFDISRELAEILSSENLWDLAVAIRQGGNHLYEVRARLEVSEAFTTTFVAWLQEASRPITNRTVFIGPETWFEFLIISPHPADVIAGDLARLDPDHRHTALRGCAPQKARAQTIPSPPAAGPAMARGIPAGPTGTGTGARPGTGPAVGAAGSGATGSGAGGAAPDDTTARLREKGAGISAANTLRVSSRTIDHLLTQVGETVTLGNLLVQGAAEIGTGEALASLAELITPAAIADERTLAALRGALAVVEDGFRRHQQASEKLHAVLDRLQEGALDLRVVPIETLFNRFPRVVRDLAQSCGKAVRLELEGCDVRIDKALIDALVDPLMHMVRNAVDHGIETAAERQARGKPGLATVLLKASQRGNEVEIEIRDDGRGLDRNKIREKALARGLIGEREARALPDGHLDRLIFHAGFSTAETLTQTSGRGVGMDVVMANVTRFGGAIDVSSTTGHGTTVRLRLPLSAAMQHSLLVEVEGLTLAIPERFLAEIHECGPEAFQSVGGQRAILLRRTYLPVFHLGQLLGRPPQSLRRAGRRSIVVLVNGPDRIGIEVDQLQRRQELFVKEVHPRIAALPGIGGASILGDGRVILILDGDDLFRLAERQGGTSLA